ncbi:MAG TPA: tail fiber domain-containing protein, partial [Steroidobacteraceae bacterium]|nr:tail fiber domain-containing protein [Steroidobacteraceae bacterium]
MKCTTHSVRGFVSGLGVAIGLTALAAPVTIPNVFTAGTPARAADVNTNFNALATAHNDTDARVTAVTTAHSDTAARVNALEAGAREPNLRPSGSLVLGPSTPSGGNILKDTQPFIHNFGEHNVFVGVQSGNFTTSALNTVAVGDGALAMVTSGFNNAAVGTTALHRNTTGFNNSAFGTGALLNNTDGVQNSALGEGALRFNTSGSHNIAVGVSALIANTTGYSNTAIGTGALHRLATGHANLAIGPDAGFDLQNGSNNIYLANSGATNESQTLRIGTTQTRAFVAGIRGRTTGSTNTVPVVIDEFGQLGTVVSSRRFKENIADMGDASSLLMRLRPVTFHYRDDRNPAGPGL